MKTLQVGEFTLRVGESAQENWDLIDAARKQGWFFHLTDFPSPYLVLECGKVEPNAHTKLRCAEICVEHSKQKGSGKVKVDATPVGNVKVDKKDAVGECDYKNEGKVDIIVVQGGKKSESDGQDQEADTARVAKGSGKNSKSSRGYEASRGTEKETATSPEVASGDHVSVRKSPAGGWATVSFKNPAVRNAVLRESGDSGIAIKSGVTVKLQPQIDPKSKEEIVTELFASWGRKVEEKIPVTGQEVLRCFDELASRATASVAKAAPSQALGERVTVRKAAAGGVAVVSFQDAALRNAVLAQGEEVTLDSGVKIKLRPQVDPKTKEEVPTDVFVAWGRKVEEKTPVSEVELVSCIDAICVGIEAANLKESDEKEAS